MTAISTIAIEYRPGEYRAAAIDSGGRAIEFRVERLHTQSLVGGIFMGRVRAVRSEIGAAFVDIGLDEDAFLNIRARKGKGKLACDVRGVEVKEGAAILVQVDRDPTTGKGARLTLNVDVPGPGSVDQNAPCPSCIQAPPSLPTRILQAWVSSATDRIVVDHDRVFDEAQKYVMAMGSADMPEIEVARGMTAFEFLEIDDVFDDQFLPVIRLASGGTIIIEQTSAMTTIDVNVGQGQNADAAGLALRTNLEAAAEVAAALRLRGIGGLIAIDFLKMKSRSDNEKVVAALKGAFADDPAQPQTTGMSAFGIVEIARQRQFSSLSEVRLGREIQPTATTIAIDALHDVRLRRGTSAVISAPREVIAELNGALKPAKTEVEAELGFVIQLETLPTTLENGYSVR